MGAAEATVAEELTNSSVKMLFAMKEKWE